MEERFQNHPDEVRGMDTPALRKTFAIRELMVKGNIRLVYSHYDRMVVGGAVPAEKELPLAGYAALKSEYFLERREMGIINIGDQGMVIADGITYSLGRLDCLYLGKGTREVSFQSADTGQPAHFYILSCPAHKSFANTLMKKAEAVTEKLGDSKTSNKRTIYKFIHEKGISSCQLVMGLTILEEGSVWNTMPAHTHHRRMEVYLYFDVKEGHRVFHFMGKPDETRHLVLGDHDAVLSPAWSIHAGCGTSSYSFIWGMAGENQSFADMDFIEIKDLL